MALALVWAALRRHPFSLGCACSLLICTTWLLDASAPLAIVVWLVFGLGGLQAWCACEPRILRCAGARGPSPLERERFAALTQPPSDLSGTGGDVLIVDRPEPWHVRGLRTVIVSRGLLDLLEDRALLGLLTHAFAPVWPASVAGQFLVRLAMLPLGGAWLISRELSQLGYLLASVIGGSLILPLLLWPQGFVRWCGRLLGALLVGLLGTLLVAGGLVGAGALLLLAWAVGPAVQALVGWEWRRTEARADQLTIEAGLGWQLLDALQTLVWLDGVPRPTGPLGWLTHSGAPMTARAERVWKSIAHV